MNKVKLEILELEVEREILIEKREFRQEKIMTKERIRERIEQLAERIVHLGFDRNGVSNGRPDEVLLRAEQERNNLGAKLQMVEGKGLNLGRKLTLLKRVDLKKESVNWKS